MKPDTRKRRTLQAQIDLAKEAECIVANYHDSLVRRDFSGVWKQEFISAMLLRIDLRFGGNTQLKDQYPEMYQANRLYKAIAKGDLSVMQEMFPERYNVFRLQMEADILEGINHDTQKDLLKELRDIRTKLDALQSTGNQPISSGTISSLNVPQFEVPDYDDEDLIGVRKDVNAGKIAANNFLASIKGLQK